MEEEEGMLSPLWPQTTNSLGRANQRRHLRRSYSIFLNSSALVIVVLVVALSFIFIVIPTLHSFISHIFKPHLVKKGWDLLNVALVLFAIICGFLGRNYNENASSSSNPSTPYAFQSQERSNPSTPQSWSEYSDRMSYNKINRLRSSSSYPDLRQESSWTDDNVGWRYYDDTHISSDSTLGLNHHQHLYPRQPKEEAKEECAQNIAAHRSIGIASTEESSSAPLQPLPSPPPPPSSPPPLPPSPPPISPPKVVRRKTKRTYQAIGRNEDTTIQQRNDWEVNNFQTPPLSSPPPLEPAILFDSESEIGGKNSKKRGMANKEFLTILRRQKKKQRQRSIENFEVLARSQSSSQAVETSRRGPTPTPPPPPPASVFHNLFTTKKCKQKKMQTPPPETLPPQNCHKLSTHVPETKSYFEATTAHTPSSPINISVNRGNESPLIPIPPPPPPPPPFKVRKWKFAVQGDFVRINSIGSSQSSSPDLDDGEYSPSNGQVRLNEVSTVQGRESPLFCSSPDVDTKANSFIERFRAGLRLEKMNSIKEKQKRGTSNLGQPQILSPETQETHPS